MTATELPTNPGPKATVGSDSSNGVTELLALWGRGDAVARDALIPLVYDELHRLAKHFLSRQRPGHTLQSTALVHEAYLRLVGPSPVHFADRAHFFAVAARVMRHILVDHARARGAARRGGNSLTMVLDEAVAVSPEREVNVIALDDALNQLATLDARQATIVEMRFFGGLSIEETATALDLSPATVKRDWVVAKTWIRQCMENC
jgi:RNA polymerase sigma-70 factor, ECF subfamily